MGLGRGCRSVCALWPASAQNLPQSSRRPFCRAARRHPHLTCTMNSSVFQLDRGLRTSLVSSQVYFTEQELKIQRGNWEESESRESEWNWSPDS